MPIHPLLVVHVVTAFAASMSETKSAEYISMVLNQLPPEFEDMVPTFENTSFSFLLPLSSSAIVQAEWAVCALHPPPANATCVFSIELAVVSFISLFGELRLQPVNRDNAATMSKLRKIVLTTFIERKEPVKLFRPGDSVNRVRGSGSPRPAARSGLARILRAMG